MTSVLSFRNVSFSYDNELVVNDVSFDIADGEVVCLLGPSGCGKTTSLRLAAGMEAPSAGEISLNGQIVSTPHEVAPPETRTIGFLFQEFALFPHLSVYDNVSFGLKSLPQEEQKKRVVELLKAVGLSGLSNKFPNSLSGGEQQRAALARALAPQPKLVLMDEPFSNLDPQLRDQMRDLTLRLLKQYGAAGLVVTHDAADAFRLADRIAVQNAGRILQIDAPQKIYDAPESLDVAMMLGTVNTRRSDDGVMAVRPHDIRLVGTADDFAFDADVQDVRAVGAAWLCKLQLTDGEGWEALIAADSQPTTGHQNFFVRRADLMLFKI